MQPARGYYKEISVVHWPCAVTFGTAKRGHGRGRSPIRPLFAVPNVIAHP